jgi:hypothetical protein
MRVEVLPELGNILWTDESPGYRRAGLRYEVAGVGVDCSFEYEEILDDDGAEVGGVGSCMAVPTTFIVRRFETLRPGTRSSKSAAVIDPWFSSPAFDGPKRFFGE